MTSCCLQDCTVWSLGIQIIGPDGSKSKLVKLNCSGIATRPNGANRPMPFQNDIIDNMVS